jgi:spermidine synthase
MDGDAQARLHDIELIKYNSMDIRWKDRYAAYVLIHKNPEDVLVIGAGGGFDVLLAALNGARKIDAVEINPTTAKLISKTYASHLNYIFSDPHVRLFVEDGRSFVKRTQKHYDVIMMCATDSVLALSTGAYILSDNYLYTKEAFIDYLDHLSDDGFIQIGRFFYYQKPRETLRVFATALEACRAKKYANPTANIVVISHTRDWADVIIKKKPFTVDEIGRLKSYCEKNNIEIIFLPSMLQDQTKNKSPFLELADNFSKGTEDKFYNEYEYNVYPVHDDNPFFYQYNKWYSKTNKNFVHSYYDKIRGVWHIFILSSLLIHSIILSFVLVLLPLIIARKDTGKPKNHFFVFIYFMTIGFGFMLLEMSIVQKFVLFLGSPIYSMAVTIPAILIFAGIGSLFSGRIKNNVVLYACLATFACSVLIWLLMYLMPVITSLLLMQSLPIRICVVILTIAPLAFFMGLPFPLALKSIAHPTQQLVPWAWAINGSSSVIASIIAIIIAMQYGFEMVLSISAAFYLVSSVTALLYRRRLAVDQGIAPRKLNEDSVIGLA